MEIVLDTVSLRSLLRGMSRREQLGTKLDKPIRERALRMVTDAAGGLVDEWRLTCGVELIDALVAQWEPYGGIRLVSKLPVIPYKTRRQLNQLGFKDTIDKRVVRLGMAAADRIIVSDDGDFWDPDPGKCGDERGVTVRLLRDELDLTVQLLGQLVMNLDVA